RNRPRTPRRAASRPRLDAGARLPLGGAAAWGRLRLASREAPLDARRESGPRRGLESRGSGGRDARPSRELGLRAGLFGIAARDAGRRSVPYAPGARGGYVRYGGGRWESGGSGGVPAFGAAR